MKGLYAMYAMSTISSHSLFAWIEFESHIDESKANSWNCILRFTVAMIIEDTLCILLNSFAHTTSCLIAVVTWPDSLVNYFLSPPHRVRWVKFPLLPCKLLSPFTIGNISKRHSECPSFPFLLFVSHSQWHFICPSFVSFLQRNLNAFIVITDVEVFFCRAYIFIFISVN